ncbi:MAG: hypothetical protein AAF456_15385 [Planctomycetota bacterium]
MAARESQGYLIAVIILVLLVLLLALGSFFGISKANEYSARVTELEAQLNVEKKLSAAYQIKGEVLKAYVGNLNKSVAEVQTEIDRLNTLTSGVDATQQQVINDVKSEIDFIREEYERDKLQNLSSDEGAAVEFTWRGHADNLRNVLAEKHKELNIKQNDILRIDRERKTDIEQKEAEVAEARRTLNEVRTNAAEREASLQQELNAANQSVQQITAQNEVSGRRADQAQQQLSSERQQWTAERTALEEDKDKLTQRLVVYEREVFDLPDGSVVRVSPGINTVHIDRGTSDALRANLKFAIYDSEVTNFVQNTQKATIEITRVTGSHSAEARIIMEDPTNPILRGDHIVSPTWDPGYSVPIALVGVFDLDYDGNSDRLRLVQQIERNGGTVVAMNDEQGNIIGEIDATTRYVVMGPELSNDTPQRVMSAINRLTEQAERNQIQPIDTRKLLNWMGQHGRARVERLDDPGDQFRNRGPSDAIPGG